MEEFEGRFEVASKVAWRGGFGTVSGNVRNLPSESFWVSGVCGKMRRRRIPGALDANLTYLVGLRVRVRSFQDKVDAEL